MKDTPNISDLAGLEITVVSGQDRMTGMLSSPIIPESTSLPALWLLVVRPDAVLAFAVSDIVSRDGYTIYVK